MNTESPNMSCPKCGAEIPPEAPQGLCPKCVMSGVATDAGGASPEISAEDAPSIERVAAAFPNLEIIELVGRGGMGFVFKARQPHLERYVALKLLPDKLAADPHFAERFNREGRVLAKLNHPHIVSVYDFGKTNDFYFLMMEFVDGVNLRQAMRAGKFSPAEALAVVPTICEALQYAHDQGILHRDIKPENILLDTQGHVKIADFGIAKLVGEEAGANVTLTMTGSSLGTPHYMAPEQLEKPSEVDHRADIYSLGVVLYEMLTGELPIGRFEAPSHKTPVGKGVDDVVFRALEKNREKRQHSATEFRTQVESANTGEVPPQLDAARKSNSSRSGLCWPATIGAVLVALSAIGFFLVVVLPYFANQSLGAPGPAVRDPGMGMPGRGVGVFSVLVLVGVPTLLVAIVGTVLGWVGLAQIKRSDGRLYGIPMGLFAALAYPVGIATLVTLAFPTLVAFPAGGGPSWLGRIIIFVIISGLLSAYIWSVVAVHRWASNRPRGHHWSTKGWAITTGVMVVMMQLLSVSSSIGRKAEFRPEPQISHIRATDRLPSGAVELLALSNHPSNGNWWRPDGSAWTGLPFENPGHNATPNGDQKAIEMVFRLPDNQLESTRARFRISGSTGSSGGSSPIQDGERMVNGHFKTVLFPKDTLSTTISVGVAVDDWETLVNESRKFPARTDFKFDDQDVFVNFLSVGQDEEGGLTVTAEHNFREKDLRVVLVTKEGKAFVPESAHWSGRRLNATFKGVQLSEVQSYRFQVLPLKWEMIEDVWLIPRDGGNQNTLSQRGVRMDFQGVELVQRNGNERLEVIYKTVEREAHLTWGTSGKFAEGPVDLLNSGSVKEQADGPALIVHKASLRIPPSVERDAVIRALTATREKWKDNSLLVLPGDQHTILSIEHGQGKTVALTVSSKLKDP